MGYYVRDLYLDSSRFQRLKITDIITRDPLTNPPTVPETTPIIAVAQLSPRIAEVTQHVTDQRGGEAVVHDLVAVAGAAAVSAYLYPDPDGGGTDIPPWLTPVVHRFEEVLREQDLAPVRERLEQAVRVADGALERLQPQGEGLDLVRAELKQALEALG